MRSKRCLAQGVAIRFRAALDKPMHLPGSMSRDDFADPNILAVGFLSKMPFSHHAIWSNTQCGGVV
jgi:hypothetical protein